MIRHHPDPGLLMAQAAGNLPGAHALLVSTHLEGCPHCRAAVREFESVGAALMEEATPVAPSPGTFARVMARVEAPAAPAVAPPVSARPGLPPGVNWPRSLRHCRVSNWRRLGPGMQWNRVTLPYDPAANVFMLRIAAGRCLPAHTHSELELTQVLHGAFDDGRAVFGPGDFDATDPSVHHQPVVQAAGECICLAAVDGRVMFDSWLARWMSALVGF